MKHNLLSFVFKFPCLHWNSAGIKWCRRTKQIVGHWRVRHPWLWHGHKIVIISIIISAITIIIYAITIIITTTTTTIITTTTTIINTKTTIITTTTTITTATAAIFSATTTQTTRPKLNFKKETGRFLCYLHSINHRHNNGGLCGLRGVILNPNPNTDPKVPPSPPPHSIPLTHLIPSFFSLSSWNRLKFSSKRFQIAEFIINPILKCKYLITTWIC